MSVITIMRLYARQLGDPFFMLLNDFTQVADEKSFFSHLQVYMKVLVGHDDDGH